jgi:hypothetical protein
MSAHLRYLNHYLHEMKCCAGHSFMIVFLLGGSQTYGLASLPLSFRCYLFGATRIKIEQLSCVKIL